MTKTKSLNMLFVALGLISVVAIMLIFYVTTGAEKLDKTITVTSDGVVEDTFSVNDLTLCPSEKQEYEITLKSEIDGNYTVSLNFDETNDGGLKSFVNVKVLCDGANVCDDTLLALLGGKVVSFDARIDPTVPVKLKVVYEMPVETGNEAQGTTASFFVRVKIEKITV